MTKKLSTIQICSIAYFLILSNNLGITTYNLFHYTRQDSLISIVLGSLIGLIPLFLFLKIMNYKPELNLFEKIEHILPKPIAIITNLIITTTVTYIITLFFYNMINFISSQYLSRTPSIIVSIAFIPAIIYILNKGLTVIGRTTFILLLISLIFLSTTIFGVIWQIDINNLLPILENGLKTPIINSFIYMCYNIIPLIILTVIPKDNIIDNEKLNKRMIITYIIANSIMLIVFFLILTVLGPNLANLYQFPEYDLLKKVSLVGFIERTETTVSLRWIFYIFIMVVMGITFISKYIKHTFKIKNKKTKRIINYILTIPIVILSNYLFKNNVEANLFIYNKLSYIIIITLLILPLLVSMKMKKGQ